jgi:hypothetical protein
MNPTATDVNRTFTGGFGAVADTDVRPTTGRGVDDTDALVRRVVAISGHRHDLAHPQVGQVRASRLLRPGD